MEEQITGAWGKRAVSGYTKRGIREGAQEGKTWEQEEKYGDF